VSPMTSEDTEARPSVVVTSRSFGSGDADPGGLLQKVGLRVEHADPAHDHAVLEEALSAAVAWIAGTSPIDNRHLAAAPNLKIVARYGTGYDSVDLAAAARRGVIVTNTPGANAEAVADHTVGLMLAALRHLVAGDRASREGLRPPLRGRELGALTVGIVGFGNIGRAVARRLIGGFGSRVLAYDPFVAPERAREAGIEPVDDLSDLARAADVLTLHMPGGGSAVVDAAFLSRMRPRTVLINTARGDLLDEQAVASALAEGRLAAAAVDVLASESATSSPLLDAPNAIITPHVAAQTTQAIDRMGMMAAEEVVRILAREAPRYPVTVPT
jgi:D-3-phosphoglycerate dehydrogenase / 2-oxoglutarate reductase